MFREFKATRINGRVNERLALGSLSFAAADVEGFGKTPQVEDSDRACTGIAETRMFLYSSECNP